MIGRAASAQTPAGREHAAVEQQQRHAVVIARHLHRRQSGEGLAGRIPQLGYKYRTVVGEWFRHGLAADYHYLATGEYYTIVHRARVCHRLHSAYVNATFYIDHVRAVRSIRILVRRRAADLEELADVVEDRIAIHAVGVITAAAGRADAALASGIDPMAVGARSGLEHLVVGDRKQPHMIVRSVDSSWVGRQQWIVEYAGQQLPARARCPQLAILVAQAAAPRAAYREYAAVRQG